MTPDKREVNAEWARAVSHIESMGLEFFHGDCQDAETNRRAVANAVRAACRAERMPNVLQARYEANAILLRARTQRMNDLAQRVKDLEALLRDIASAGDRVPRYWLEGTVTIERHLAEATKGEQLSAPLLLSADQVPLWHRAQREAYRHALEKMGVPVDLRPAETVAVG